jgi:hypothetical protein
MVHYTVITKDIVTIEGNNKLEAILVYSYIKSREDYTTHSIDNLTYGEISRHLNIPLQTVKNIVPTLYRNTALFKDYIHNTKLEDNEEIKTRITYYFHESYSNFFYIDNNLFNEEHYTKVPYTYINKVRGLLLLLKAHCLNGTNNFFFQRKSKSGINYAELSRLFVMDRDTIENYLTIALDGGLVKKIPNGLAIIDKNIKAYIGSNNCYGELYQMICNWCAQKKITPPPYEHRMLGALMARYGITTKAIIGLAKKNDKKPNEFFKIMREDIKHYPLLYGFLPYVMTIRKIQPTDGYLTWNYLFKALNLKLPEKPQPINCDLYIM